MGAPPNIAAIASADALCFLVLFPKVDCAASPFPGAKGLERRSLDDDGVEVFEGISSIFRTAKKESFRPRLLAEGLSVSAVSRRSSSSTSTRDIVFHQWKPSSSPSGSGRGAVRPLKAVIRIYWPCARMYTNTHAIYWFPVLRNHGERAVFEAWLRLHKLTMVYLGVIRPNLELRVDLPRGGA